MAQDAAGAQFYHDTLCTPKPKCKDGFRANCAALGLSTWSNSSHTQNTPFLYHITNNSIGHSQIGARVSLLTEQNEWIAICWDRMKVAESREASGCGSTGFSSMTTCAISEITLCFSKQLDDNFEHDNSLASDKGSRLPIDLLWNPSKCLGKSH